VRKNQFKRLANRTVVSARLIPAALLASLLLASPRAARASPIIIDDFNGTVTSTIFQSGTGTTSSAAVSGTGILGTRTISVSVAIPLTSAAASAGLSPGLATASFNGSYSPVNPADKFDVLESFASQNAPGAGLDELSFLIGSSLGTSATITANGSSTFTFTDPASALGITHNIPFASFSNPGVFSNLTSLDFTETFPNAGISGPSVSFSGPIVLGSDVPEPASLSLLVLGGMAFLSRRQRSACAV
jgi:hypothetical protein